MREMKYDFTPKALENLRNDANKHFDEARGSLATESTSKFQSLIPTSWSSTGLYRRDAFGASRAYAKTMDSMEDDHQSVLSKLPTNFAQSITLD